MKHMRRVDTFFFLVSFSSDAPMLKRKKNEIPHIRLKRVHMFYIVPFSLSLTLTMKFEILHTHTRIYSCDVKFLVFSSDYNKRAENNDLFFHTKFYFNFFFNFFIVSLESNAILNVNFMTILKNNKYNGRNNFLLGLHVSPNCRNNKFI